MTELDLNDKLKVVGDIRLSGLETGRIYKKIGLETINGRLLYVLKPVDGLGNKLKLLLRDIDAYLEYNRDEKPYLTVKD